MSAIGALCAPTPTRHFSTLVANKALIQFDAWATLAWRLGGPCVALGWPKGDPWVTQSQSQTQSGPIRAPLLRANGRNPKQAEGRKVKAPWFIAHAVAFSGQKLRANSQKPNCQISFLAHTLGRCWSIAPFVRLINCEIGQSCF